MSATKLLNGLTLKQDRFCHEFIANGGNATQAYRAAYDAEGNSEATTNQAASRLLHDSNLAARIEELRDQAVAFAGISPESIATEFDENRRLAAKWESASAMNTATERKADLKDLFGKRKLDVRTLNINADVDMSVEELRVLVGGLEAKALGDGKE
jgi:type II secretory pathway component HofQ